MVGWMVIGVALVVALVSNHTVRIETIAIEDRFIEGGSGGQAGVHLAWLWLKALLPWGILLALLLRIL